MKLNFLDYTYFITYLIKNHRRRDLFSLIQSLNPTFSSRDINLVVDFLFMEIDVSEFDVTFSFKSDRGCFNDDN